ncbi:M23 family metallopeptidase [Microbacterium allomyrinae]|uniref:M23 family metallopeptidase n=1 Tax=Microbacterium allomyrinae TaxID=2830666 RepID=A0A9X1LYB0_9MICO|nr:M23 family metallopeptidase [Microbacterium allomyrinae]MCC2034112.1 M23 family metallopeptidase [Microbacterium allomyrinae]
MLYPNGTTTAPTVSSKYGPRTGGLTNHHDGCDFVNFDSVYAIAAGLVTFAGWLNDAAGYTVIIDHGNGIASKYMHLAVAPAVRKGSWIGEGAKLGLMGASGNATGKNLHFEIWVGGWHTDPVAWLAGRVGQLVVDGGLGGFTIAAWQADLGTPADGKLDTPSAFVHRLQERLNGAGARDWDGRELLVDGLGLASNIGRRVGRFRTVHALQVYLGTPADGYLDANDSATIRRVQERLNAGSF